jgi:hypothetical protein
MSDLVTSSGTVDNFRESTNITSGTSSGTNGGYFTSSLMTFQSATTSSFRITGKGGTDLITWVTSGASGLDLKDGEHVNLISLRKKNFFVPSRSSKGGSPLALHNASTNHCSFSEISYLLIVFGGLFLLFFAFVGLVFFPITILFLALFAYYIKLLLELRSGVKRAQEMALDLQRNKGSGFY